MVKCKLNSMFSWAYTNWEYCSDYSEEDMWQSIMLLISLELRYM